MCGRETPGRPVSSGVESCARPHEIVRMLKPIVVVASLILIAFAPLSAQQSDAYLDATARELVARARASRGRQVSEI